MSDNETRLFVEHADIAFDNRARRRKLGARGLGATVAGAGGLMLLALITRSETPCMIGMATIATFVGSLAFLLSGLRARGPNGVAGSVVVTGSEVQIVRPGASARTIAMA